MIRRFFARKFGLCSNYLTGSNQQFSWLFILIVTLVVSLGFLLKSSITYRIGFPLDDAWIHQTFARSIVENKEWEYFPGQITSGSTSPLWTLILAAGYIINAVPYTWAFIVGILSLFATGLIGEAIFRTQVKNIWGKLPIMGMFLVGEWHLIWAAVSGMETILFALVILIIIYILLLRNVNWFLTGLFTGLAVWVRPDGLTLLGPIIFVLIFSKLDKRHITKYSIRILMGFLIFFIPYLLFNQLLSGTWMPNTFYAKQAEYAILIQQPILVRLFNVISLPMVGSGILLLPGMVFSIYFAVKERRWAIVAAMIWWLGYNFIYAVQLPVIYQHGRYLIPGMSIYFVIAGIGAFGILSKVMSQNLLSRVVKKVYVLSLFFVWVVFIFLGARAYASDVTIIESEMVDTSHWISAHTEKDAIIAAHDIGALGYFGDRQIIDLAGLISPEVIPFIRDEKRLAEYLDQKRTSYLVTFPNWYPDLIKRGELIYQSSGILSVKLSGENMRIYRWKK